MKELGGCGSDRCDCGAGMDRRQFLTMAGLGVVAAAAGRFPAMAGPFEPGDFEKLIPADKKLSPEWVKSLFERGEPTLYRGAELERIGMPVSGIGSGHVYLGGDGKLWLWDVFNLHRGTGDANYARPLMPSSPLDQGFAIRMTWGSQKHARTLDRAAFSDATFRGEYPIGFVEYVDSTLPVRVSLEAFSPFVPLDAESSSLPVTLMRFTLRNTSSQQVECELAGWLENAVGLSSAIAGMDHRRNRVLRGPGYSMVECLLEPVTEDAGQPPVVFADFDGGSYGDWKVEGDAFGKAPSTGAPGPVQRLSGFQGKGLVNTWVSSDEPRGKLTSPVFTIERPFISFLIGGGNHPGETCINLVVDGKTVRSSTARNSDAMYWDNWQVGDLAGSKAHLEIIDNHSGGWGHIDIDQIEFGDRPRRARKAEEQPDFGTMAIAVIEGGQSDLASASLAEGKGLEGVFSPEGLTDTGQERKPVGQTLRGAVGRRVALAPGGEATITFALAWHFPNLRIDGLPDGGRYYARRFKSAVAVIEHVAERRSELYRQTRLWHDTWYDSTLPRWFLDRTFLNASILGTSTCLWLGTGRFWAWEGVGCCHGTCTHVWHYAQAVGRLFPQIERSLRERVDFGVAFHEDTGIVGFRAEFDPSAAIDGQAGTILRTYREHQMSADDAFLKRHWPKAKKALEFLIGQDGNADGILEGGQHNTLDSSWFGPVAWLSSLYLAALRAGEEMAREVGDAAFAKVVRAIFEAGSKQVVERLWNGEYFIHIQDPKHPEAIGSGPGCEIDQVFGQSWAFQVGLGRILSQEHVRKALQALWRYNFTPDVGQFRNANKSGRWYAMPGEGGLIMCTFPKGGSPTLKDQPNAWTAGYFNECMSGFEYQVAGHMIWEGMVMEGLAITRAIHDRYHASRRNPWNEVECGDHYARAMASYGVYLAACGYEYHGPKGHLGFAPRLRPEDFRAAFTTAEGWGTFSQRRMGDAWRWAIELRHGRLRLKTLSCGLPDGSAPQDVQVQLGNRPVKAQHKLDGNRLHIDLAELTELGVGESLEVRFGSAGR